MSQQLRNLHFPKVSGSHLVPGTAVFNALLESYMRGTEGGIRKNNFKLMRFGESLKKYSPVLYMGN